MAGRRLQTYQHGAALLVFVILMVTATLTYLVNSFSSTDIEQKRQWKTDQALALARDALIGYALKFRDEKIMDKKPDRVYGYIVMPDLGSSRNNNAGCTTEGCETNTPTGISLVDGTLPTLVGRFPWRTLGIEPLRDGYEECLWLIVSAPHLSGNSSPTDRPNAIEMNWDTLGQFDIAIAQGANALVTLYSQADKGHDRPVAIILAPGAILSGQNRGQINNGDEVTQCGGNYDPRNYLDPTTISTTDIGNYFEAADALHRTHGQTGDLYRSNDPDTPKSLTTSGSIAKSGSTLIAGGCKQFECLSNDIGLPISNSMIFTALRKQSYFRSDIDALLANVGNRLASSPPSSLEPVDNAVTPALFKRLDKNESGITDIPANYFRHYWEQMHYVEVANKATCTYSNPQNCLQVALFDQATTAAPQVKLCPAVLALGSERNTTQRRVTETERLTRSNYLEGANLLAFTQTGANTLVGALRFERPRAGHLKSQDVLRCIPEAGYSESNPTGAELITVQNTALGDATKQLARYDRGTGTVALGQKYAGGTSPVNAELYGCAWKTETRALLTGFRHYFKFKINDPVTSTDNALEGFALAMVDADINGPGACGASQHHLGFSGSNGDTSRLQPPKIGLEFDLRLQGPTYPTTSATRRNDPSYTGGHFGWVYWGTDADINDDNVHGRGGPALFCPPTPPDTYVTQMPSPLNPVAPGTPTLGKGIYKLDPSLSGVPLNQDIHVRVEVTRSTPAPSVSLPAVRVATTTNINLASPGVQIDGEKVVIIDGIKLAIKDRVLVRAQTLAYENGIYVLNGTDTAMTRADDFDAPAELAGAVVEVAEGVKYALSSWHQATATPTVGLSPLSWTQVPVKLVIDSISSTTPGFNSLQGFPLQVGDRLLVKQDSYSGIWSWQGTNNPMLAVARPPPYCTPGLETCLQAGASVRISKGTDNNTWMRYDDDGAEWLPLAQASFSPQRNIDLTGNEKPTDGCLEPDTGQNNLVLLRFQNDAKENGLYEWNGGSLTKTATPMPAAILQVRQGSDMGRAFRQTTFQQTGDSISFSPIDPVFSTGYTVQAWVLKESATDAERIAIMKDTSRPMKMLEIGLTSPPFPPHVSDLVNIYYPFRHVQLGFTAGQRRLTSRNNDQTILITDQATTWLQ